MNQKSTLHPLTGAVRAACVRTSAPSETNAPRAAFAIPHEYRREPVDRLLKISEVVVLTGMCRSSVYNRLRDGDFVRCVKVGPRSIRFPESEVRAWIAKLLLERDTKGAQDARA
jgi:prophage regulatory protein